MLSNSRTIRSSLPSQRSVATRGCRQLMAMCVSMACLLLTVKMLRIGRSSSIAALPSMMMISETLTTGRMSAVVARQRCSTLRWNIQFLVITRSMILTMLLLLLSMLRLKLAVLRLACCSLFRSLRKFGKRISISDLRLTSGKMSRIGRTSALWQQDLKTI